MVIFKKSFTAAVFTTLLVALSACNQQVTFSNVSVALTNNSDAMCADFSLSSEQVQSFFNRAHEIDALQMHDDFDYLPCSVAGQITQTTQTPQLCDYSLQAGGTAELNCRNGKSFIFACKDCDDVFISR